MVPQWRKIMYQTVNIAMTNTIEMSATYKADRDIFGSHQIDAKAIFKTYGGKWVDSGTPTYRVPVEQVEAAKAALEQAGFRVTVDAPVTDKSLTVPDLLVTDLIQLTPAETRLVEEHLQTSVHHAIHLLLAAQNWAWEKTTPQDFESRFPEFVASYKLSPAMAQCAVDYVWQCQELNEPNEADEPGLELLFSHKEDFDEADQQAWAAFMDSCTECAQAASASMNMVVRNCMQRGLPTTEGELCEAMALAHLREWTKGT
jgi:hypothetical protein